jgi:hypothetical protein
MLQAGMVSEGDLAWMSGLSEWQSIGSLMGDDEAPPTPPQVAQVRKPNEAGTPIDETDQVLTEGEGCDSSHIDDCETEVEGVQVGGWLVVFCVLITIVGPISWSVSTASTWSIVESLFEQFPSFRTSYILEACGLAAINAYGIWTGFRVWSGGPNGRELARQFLTIRLSGFVLLELVGVATMMDLPPEILSGGIEGLVKGIFKELSFFTVWWAYFKRSKRVRETYGPLGEGTADVVD